MAKLEEAFFSLGIYIIRYRRSAQLDGFFEHFLHCGMKTIQLCPGESSGLAARANAGAKERLVRIDVADAVQQFLV